MAAAARRHGARIAALVVALGFLVLAPGEALAVTPDYSTVLAPGSLQKLESHPVEIVIRFKAGVRRDTFRAWLNGTPITARFVATPTGVRASVDVPDGLRVGLASDGPLKTLNALTTLVSVTGHLPDADLQLFFVREVSVEVPSVVGLSSEAAQAALAAAGLAAGPVSEVVRASLHTGTVLSQSPAPGAQVPRGSSVALTRVAAPPHDIALPDSWRGLWNMRLTYRDAATGFIDSVLPLSDAICSADPIGVAALEATAAANPAAGLASCSASATDDRIDVTCSGEVQQIFCSVPVSARLSLVKSGELLTGTGEWSVGDSCGIPLASQGQTIELTGRRSNADPGAACAGPPSSLLQKFVKNNLLLLLGGEL